MDDSVAAFGWRRNVRNTGVPSTQDGACNQLWRSVVTARIALIQRALVMLHLGGVPRIFVATLTRSLHVTVVRKSAWAGNKSRFSGEGA